MKDINSLFTFIKSQGFIESQSVNSNTFGDYLVDFSNENIALRFIRDRSVESISICSISEMGEWYDLVLVMALINEDIQLDKRISIDEYIVFLKCNLIVICDLFSSNNYLNTKLKLEDLGKQRVMQMFPQLNKK